MKSRKQAKDMPTQEVIYLAMQLQNEIEARGLKIGKHSGWQHFKSFDEWLDLSRRERECTDIKTLPERVADLGFDKKLALYKVKRVRWMGLLEGIEYNFLWPTRAGREYFFKKGRG